MNSIKTTVLQLQQALYEEGIVHEQADWNPRVFRLPEDLQGTNWPYNHGWLRGQEEISTLLAWGIDPDPASVSGTPAPLREARPHSSRH